MFRILITTGLREQDKKQPYQKMMRLFLFICFIDLLFQVSVTLDKV